MKEIAWVIFLGVYHPPIHHLTSCGVGILSCLPFKAMEVQRSRPVTPCLDAQSTKQESQDETVWDKLGTLGRKKKNKTNEAQNIIEEGKHAIEYPNSPVPYEPLEESDLHENEEVSMIEPGSYDEEKFNTLIDVLIEWINKELATKRIIVQDLEEDLYDGQVLKNLYEVLTSRKLDVPEVTQSEEGQKEKLHLVLSAINRCLGYNQFSQPKWNVVCIHSKNLVSMLHLLVALVRHFRPPVRLPENISVNLIVVQRQDGQFIHRTRCEQITSQYDDIGMICESDAFDSLFDHAPHELQIVKESLLTFVNKHLTKLDYQVSHLDTQFHDGVFLILLMGLLEGFFVPLYSFYMQPHEFNQKVHNVSLAFDLMQEVGLSKPKARPEDLVNLDLKSTLRVLYNLYTKYNP